MVSEPTVFCNSGMPNITNFTCFHILWKMKVLESRKLPTSVFLMSLHVLGCPEHDFIIYAICLPVCDTNFVAALTQKLMDGNEWNFSFSWILP